MAKKDWGVACLLILSFVVQAEDRLGHKFDNLGIRELIELAQANHPSVNVRHHEARAAQAGLDGARAQYLPSPSIQYQHDHRDRNAQVSLTQPLWAGGRLDAGLEAAQYRVEEAEHAVQEIRLELAYRVSSAWGTWLQARGRIGALESGVDLLQKYAESVNRRIAAGASGAVDRDLVHARLAQTRGDLSAARAAERTACARLSQLTGQPLNGSEIRYENWEDALFVKDIVSLPSLSSITEQALANSPALRRRQSALGAAQAEVEQRRAARWPTVNLRLQHQRGDVPSAGRIESESRAMVVLDYSPGAGNSLSAQIDEAAARARATQSEIEIIRSETSDASATDYEEITSAQERLEQLHNTLKANDAVLASYNRLFVAGKRSWLDVLNTAREVTQTRVGVADARAQLASSRVRLLLRTGAFQQQAPGSQVFEFNN